MRAISIGIIAFALLVNATPAQAGEQWQSAYCYRYSDGSGYCQGNFLGFRNSSDANAYAYFWGNSYGIMGFVASYAGNYGSCVAEGTSVGNVWPQLMANRGFFSISWDASGTCSSIYYRNGSLDSNY